jgi:transcriptional regulator with XRE-family HTH domain
LIYIFQDRDRRINAGDVHIDARIVGHRGAATALKRYAVAFGGCPGIIGYHENWCSQSVESHLDPMSFVPTMKDVAKRAGVHHSTVSRVLSNSRQITESTRRRVLKAVEELGYRPNPYVSILMRSRSRRRRPEQGATLTEMSSKPLLDKTVIDGTNLPIGK